MKKTKKKQQTRFKFLCPLFGVEVILHLGDKKQIKEHSLDLEINKSHLAECILYSDEDDNPIDLTIWVKDKTDFYSMVHETLHLVKQIFGMKNIPFNSDNDELIAYYQGYWVRKFWNKMSKFIKENK